MLARTLSLSLWGSGAFQSLSQFYPIERILFVREKCKEKLSITDTVLFFFLSSFNIEMGSRPN